MENKVNSSGASGPVTGATGSYVSCWADVQIPKLFMSSKRINMFVTEADSEEQFHRILDFMWAVWCRLRRFDHESVCQLYSLLFDFCFEVYDEKSIFFLISNPGPDALHQTSSSMDQSLQLNNFPAVSTQNNHPNHVLYTLSI